MLTIEARGAAARRISVAVRTRLKRRMQRAMEAAGTPRGELALSLVVDAEIRRLNREWREVDAPTDVLSFSMREGEGGALHPELLGDVVISVETAARQARASGRALEEELLHLAVHGLAHLLGYDHATADEEKRMFGWEERLRGEALRKAAVRKIPRP